MIVKFWRHFPTGKQDAKQAHSTNLSAAGREYGRYSLAQYFPTKPPYEKIFCSTLTRANESAFLMSNHKNKTPIPVVSNSVFDEWNITDNIGGKSFETLENEGYFQWRAKVFQEMQTKLRYNGCESLLDLGNRFVNEGLKVLTQTPEDKVVVTHSQYIAAGLSTIKLGLDPDPEDLVMAFKYFFPRLHGTVAILKYENGIWSIENKSYTAHLPIQIPEMT